VGIPPVDIYEFISFIQNLLLQDDSCPRGTVSENRILHDIPPTQLKGMIIYRTLEKVTLGLLERDRLKTPNL
jgi:hypothetical protein